MSFILDALKRAERDRRLEKAPDLSAVYEEDPLPRRKTWLWGVISGCILLGVVLSALVLWPMLTTSNERNVNGRDTNQRSADVVKRDVPGHASVRDLSKAVSKDASRDRVPSTERSPAETESKAVASDAPGIDRAAGPPVTPRVSSTGSESEPVTKGVPASVDGTKPDRPLTDTRTGELQTESAPPDMPETAEGVDVFEDEPPSSPPSDQMAQKAKSAPAQPIPLVSQLPDAIKESLEGLEINVHVYSEDPQERLVFINMRNRKVGDRIGETGPTLKEITPDGVIIDYGEGQALLRVGR